MFENEMHDFSCINDKVSVKSAKNASGDRDVLNIIKLAAGNPKYAKIPSYVNAIHATTPPCFGAILPRSGETLPEENH